MIDILDERLEELSFQIQVAEHLICVLNVGLTCANESLNERPDDRKKSIRSLLFNLVGCTYL